MYLRKDTIVFMYSSSGVQGSFLDLAMIVESWDVLLMIRSYDKSQERFVSRVPCHGTVQTSTDGTGTCTVVPHVDYLHYALLRLAALSRLPWYLYDGTLS